MAPYPEEIDVFSVPHSRMKQLVDVYSEKLTCTDFTDYFALESLLHDLHHTFREFKSHEQIENRYIMKKLKKRLKSLSIHDAAVCNCHSDNRLSDMLELVMDGYSCTSKPEADRINFGIKLQNALQEFTGVFLPHMKEEEEVFQPMLMKYFGYEELKCLKEQVIKEHSKWHAYDVEKEVSVEKPNATIKVDYKTAAEESTFLPPEVLSYIFSFLSPRDILRCSEVCRSWYEVSRNPSLWKAIYPCFWAHGIWEDYDENHEDQVLKFYPGDSPGIEKFLDEDVDVDDYEEATEDSLEDDANNNNFQIYAKETDALKSIVKYLLPQVGVGVQKIVLSSCRGLTSSLLRSILILCPNVVHLDVSHTSIMDSAFKRLKDYSSCLNLQHLDLSGCLYLTDVGLFRLADCMASLPPYVPNASQELRDVYLADCERLSACLPPDITDNCCCEIEDVGAYLCNSNMCSSCTAAEFCASVCLWQKNGIMCHLAKLSLQCPYVSTSERSKDFQVSGATGGILRTSATLLSDHDSNRTGEIKSLKYLSLSGCKEVTDDGLRCLLDVGVISKLEFLDVSGCWLLSGSLLRYITETVISLLPENIYYCNQITDGPYPDLANGCQNLESDFRACCCRRFL